MPEKQISFRKLPLLRANPLAWRAHLDQMPSLPTYLHDPALNMAPTEVSALMEHHMPELLPEFDTLVTALPEFAAQGLALYNIKPFFAGCSCSIRRPGGGRATLLRNYDLGLDDHDGFLRYEPLDGGGWIIGSAEGGWGYVDGLNDRGLAVAITFGGRFVAGDGFAIPIVVRYLLQTCSTTNQAVERLTRLPHRLAQNLILLDRKGHSAVVYVSPDEGVIVDQGGAACTNHQRRVTDPRHAQFVRTVERLEHLQALGGDASLTDFLQPPLRSQNVAGRFVTLYSVELDPVGGAARYAWPGRELLLTPESPACDLVIHFPG